MKYYILYTYIVGMVLAFILGCIEAYRRHKKGESIEQFPGMIAQLSLLSWLYVVMFFKNLYKEKHPST